MGESSLVGVPMGSLCYPAELYSSALSERELMYPRQVRTCWLLLVAAAAIMHSSEIYAQTVAPAYAGRFRVDKLINLNGPATQMEFGPDGRLYLRLVIECDANY